MDTLEATAIQDIFQDDVSESDEMTPTELLVHISMALLIIFMMANLLFKQSLQEHLDGAKEKWWSLYVEGREIGDTPKITIYESRERALIELQKQKLLLALEKLERIERQELELHVFSKKVNGNVVFNVEDVLSGEKVKNQRFISSCAHANKVLSSRKSMQRTWFHSVLFSVGFVDSQEKQVEDNELISLDNKNRKWLFGEINKRVENLYVESCGLQRAVLAMLQRYYQKNPGVLRDTDVYKLVKRFPTASPEEQETLIPQIREELYQHSKQVFEKQNAPFLDDV